MGVVLKQFAGCFRQTPPSANIYKSHMRCLFENVCDAVCSDRKYTMNILENCCPTKYFGYFCEKVIETEQYGQIYF